MKSKLFSIIFCLFSVLGIAQPDIRWAQYFGSSSLDMGLGIACDAAGNIYTTGAFADSIDLDFGPGTHYVLSSGADDIFIVKHTSNGDFVWAKAITNSQFNQGSSITIDNAGNVLVTGLFFGNVDFDPGPGTANLNTFSTEANAFILKLDSNGNFVWVKKISSPGGDSSEGICVSTDNSNNVYVLGDYSTGIDLDPGAGTVYASGFSNQDLFLTKLDPSGNFIWGQAFSGPGWVWPTGVRADNLGNVFVSGSFEDSIDLDFNVPVQQIKSKGDLDMFLCKMDINGNILWVNQYGSISEDRSRSMDMDNSGNVYLGGNYKDTVDFDGGPGIINLYSNHRSSAFYLKTDNNGNTLYAKNISNPAADLNCNALAVGASGNLYGAGVVGYNTTIPTAQGNFNNPTGTAIKYFTCINSLGDIIWAKPSNWLDSYPGQNLTVDANENIYTTGDFSNTCNFDPQTGNYTFTSTGSNDIYLLSIGKSKGVGGKLYLDLSQDCNPDFLEPALNGRYAVIQPGNLIVQTNSAGFWYLDSLPVGSYTITVDTTGNWFSTCGLTYPFTVLTNSEFTEVAGIGLYNNSPCTYPDVTINMYSARPCFNNQNIYVNVSNGSVATNFIDSNYLYVKLDSLITPTNASLPFSSMGNNTYLFYIGDIYPNQNISFNIEADVSCNAVVGQTLCLQATLSPTDSCYLDNIPTPNGGGVLPCTLPWDHSSISVESWCQNDSIYFTIANIGTGDMQCYSPSRIYLDAQLIIQDSFLLNQGEIDTLIFSGDGRTWRLEADQHPLHPGNSHPSTTIELCGPDTNWTSGLVNLFPMNDADPNVDIYCVEVSASYDPNDKTGFPLGITDTHFIAPNQKMEYIIRFQNTGTDTAFTVVIRDTLEMDFNIFSVQSGVSSHNYSFTMHGPRVLEWTFNNILLPDSTTDEEGSHGFVTFSVKQLPNLSPGTELNNEVGIYFDFNSPVITNTTSHVIKTPPSIPDFSGNGNYSETGCEEILYNGLSYNSSGTYYQIQNDSLWILNFVIGTGVDNNVIQNNYTLTANTTGATYQWLDCNNNYSIITSETNQSFTATANGSYAVSITENGCTDTSACFTISTVGISENRFGNDFKIFPNPSNGKLFIDLGKNTEKINVSVKNAIGQIVFENQVSKGGVVELSLNVESGIYFIELISNLGESRIFKMVIE